jgi:hypothetical protein
MVDLVGVVEHWRRRLRGEAPADGAAVGGLPAAWRQRGGLGEAECDLVLLASLAVLDGELAVACGERRGRPDEPWPTLSLALQLIPGLRLDAVVSAAPVRRLGLVEVADPSAPLRSRLSAPERVWAALGGVRVPDPLLTAVAAPAGPVADRLPPGLPGVEQAGVDRIVLYGAARDTLAPVARRLALRAGMPPLRVRAELLPGEPEQVARALRRERLMEDALPVIDLLDADAAARHRALRLVRGLPGVVVVLDHQPLPLGEGSVLPVAVAPPTLTDRIAGWQDELAPLGLSPRDRDALAWQLGDSVRLSAAARASAVALAAAQPDPVPALWRGVQAHAVQPPGRLVQVSRPQRDWGELVCENGVQETLQELVSAARNRARVIEAWGMGGGRAGGLTALFTGPSGTGKTLAAELVASSLRRPLWRIDLSMVVSKYIGETEKHLGAVFDAAEGSGAVLLFDEADALFAQRSDVGDARDRYANLEVGFLLQRIEAFGGLAVLTTNLEDQLDAAFQRRMSTVVRFGFPGRDQREELWRRVFPAAVPTAGLDHVRLAQVQLTGAGIRAVATRAAFLAAAGVEPGEPVPPITMELIGSAVRRWLEQQGRPLSRRELEGWG